MELRVPNEGGTNLMADFLPSCIVVGMAHVSSACLGMPVEVAEIRRQEPTID